MKKKKILLGLTFGAIMATTPLIAGCSSDITFNQENLDNAINSANEYLQMQNNYSSEFAKNDLNDYLLRGIERNQNNSQFGYKITHELQNSFNDTYNNYAFDYKMYKQDNAIKELCSITGDVFSGNGLKVNTNNYREVISEYKQIIAEPGTMAKGKTYYYSGSEYCEDISKTDGKYSKNTLENKTKAELNDWMIFGDVSNIYSNLMLAIVTPEASTFGMGDNYVSNQSDFVRGQDGDFETFKFTNVFTGTQGGEIVVLSFNVRFLNGVLHSITFTNSVKNDFTEALQTSQVITIEISEKIDDFTFDKSPY